MGSATSSRTPPHDIDAERALLGAMLLSADAIRAGTHLGPSDFYREDYGAVFAAILRRHQAGEPVDVVTVAADLNGRLDITRGALDELTADVSASANAAGYATVIAEAAQHRRTLALAGELGDIAYRAEPIPTELLTRLTDAARPATGRALRTVDLNDALDAELPAPGVLHRADGAGLLYPGTVNYLIGEPESGKSLVALLAAVATVEAGGRVLVLDYEDTAPPLARRLLALGATRAHVIDRVIYAADPRARDLPALAVREAASVDLVIVDGVAAALAAADLDENDANDVSRWWDTLPAPMAATGATVIPIDHQAKSKDQRGLWPRGSGAKQARIDGAAYIVTKTEPFNRTTAGRIRLTVAKDRHGALPAPTGATVASIYVQPHDNGRHIRTTIDVPLPEAPAGDTKATIRADLTVAVLDELGNADKPTSVRTLGEALRAKPHRLTFSDRALRIVLKELKDDGAITHTDGPRGADLYALPTSSAPEALSLPLNEETFA